MNIVLLGAPGSGKGTQGSWLSDKLSVPVLTMSAVLKDQKRLPKPLAASVAESMQKGSLVSDEIIWQCLNYELEQDLYKCGVIFDGFPRTVAQAQLLQSGGLTLDAVLVLQVREAVLEQRLAGRRIGAESGAVYHVSSLKDVKEPLLERPDDAPEVVRKRLAVYREMTQPLVEWFRHNSVCSEKVHELDAEESIEAVRAQIVRCLRLD